MAAGATFQLLVQPGPLDGSLMSGGFVGPDGRKYQMIPTGDRSMWRVSTRGGTVRITSKDPNVAQLADGFARPLPRNLLTISSAAEKITDFFILAGPGAGRTTVVAEDARGQNLDNLTISVKTVVPKTFMIHRLNNITMKTKRSKEEVGAMMRDVKNTYKLQANVVLANIEQSATDQLLTIANEYGDPIDLEKRKPIKGNSSQTTDFDTDVINALTASGKFGRADFHMVSVCQMNGPLGKTPGFRTICYVSHTFRPDLVQETTTYAHELGHAFKLEHDHPRHAFADMMAAGNVIGHVDSFRMTDEDIDHINPSGT